MATVHDEEKLLRVHELQEESEKKWKESQKVFQGQNTMTCFLQLDPRPNFSHLPMALPAQAKPSTHERRGAIPGVRLTDDLDKLQYRV